MCSRWRIIDLNCLRERAGWEPDITALIFVRLLDGGQCGHHYYPPSCCALFYGWCPVGMARRTLLGYKCFTNDDRLYCTFNMALTKSIAVKFLKSYDWNKWPLVFRGEGGGIMGHQYMVGSVFIRTKCWLKWCKGWRKLTLPRGNYNYLDGDGQPCLSCNWRS